MSLESERPGRAGCPNRELWSGGTFTLMSQGHCRQRWVAAIFFEAEFQEANWGRGGLELLELFFQLCVYQALSLVYPATFR